MDTGPTNQNHSGTNAHQLLRIDEVVALTTLSRSCLHLWIARGRFPKPAALSSTVKVWRASDISAWIDEQFKQADDPDCKPKAGLATVE